jgi:hypothetical protein
MALARSQRNYGASLRRRRKVYNLVETIRLPHFVGQYHMRAQIRTCELDKGRRKKPPLHNMLATGMYRLRQQPLVQ